MSWLLQNGIAINIVMHISFELDICPGVGLMDPMATLFLVFFKELPFSFAIVASSVYIPANNVGGFPFLHTLSSTYYL